MTVVGPIWEIWPFLVYPDLFRRHTPNFTLAENGELRAVPIQAPLNPSCEEATGAPTAAMIDRLK